MSVIDLAILGMLLEGPRSAYAIQKDVQYHHYDKWCKIATPTIYQNVHKLQLKGYLQSEQEPGEKHLNRAVYTITEKGRSYFLQLMNEYAEQQVRFLFDFNIVISNLNKIDHSQALNILLKLQQNIAGAAAENKKTAEKYVDIPLVGRTIFKQQQQLYRALLQWLTEFQIEYIYSDAEGK